MSRKRHDELIEKLIGDGKLIEAGFEGLRAAAIPPDAPDIQISEMRMAFLAGAQHLYASIMSSLDPGEEPTEKDMERMSKIADELDNFARRVQLQLTPTAGGRQ